MADFTVQIIENIKLNGVQRGSQVNKIISGINYTDNRILNTFSGSETTIFSLSDVDGAGTFVTSSLKYARITNIDTTASINLKVSSSTEQLNFKVTPVIHLCYLHLILQEVFYLVVMLYFLMET